MDELPVGVEKAGKKYTYFKGKTLTMPVFRKMRRAGKNTGYKDERQCKKTWLARCHWAERRESKPC